MLTPEQAAAAATQALADRTDAVARLAQARIDLDAARTRAAQELREVKERTEAAVKDADKAARDAWREALKAGWTPSELARIGIPAPRTPKKRPAKRSEKTTRFSSGSADTMNADLPHTDNQGQQP